MPRWQPWMMKEREGRRAAVASLVAEKLSLKLWPFSLGSRKWYARLSETDPWSTGHTAVGIRDWLVRQILRELLEKYEGVDEAYWRDVWTMTEMAGKYRLLQRVQEELLERYPVPEDLPS